MNLQDELRRALEPTAPPADFAERVRMRVATGRAPARHTTPVRRLGVPLALAASLAAVAAAGSMWLVHGQRLERERARDQLLLALQVASEELRVVEARLERRDVGAAEGR